MQGFQLTDRDSFWLFRWTLSPDFYEIHETIFKSPMQF